MSTIPNLKGVPFSVPDFTVLDFQHFLDMQNNLNPFQEDNLYILFEDGEVHFTEAGQTFGKHELHLVYKGLPEAKKLHLNWHTQYNDGNSVRNCVFIENDNRKSNLIPGLYQHLLLGTTPNMEHVNEMLVMLNNR